MEKMNIRMGMRMSSLPLSFFTSAAIPASSAPVSVTIPRKPPRINTNRQTGRASVKPLTGAVATLATVAPWTPSTPASDITTVTSASTIRMISRMVNDDIDRFFLLFSFAFSVITTPPNYEDRVGYFGEREVFKRISGSVTADRCTPVAVACAETHATARRAEAGGSLPLTRKKLYAVMTVPVRPRPWGAWSRGRTGPGR